MWRARQQAIMTGTVHWTAAIALLLVLAAILGALGILPGAPEGTAPR